jgi:hypothetical protein
MTGWTCHLQLLLILAIAIFYWVSVAQDTRAYFILLVTGFLQPGRLHIYIPQEEDGPIVPQALGSLFIASCDSQGYIASMCNAAV